VAFLQGSPVLLPGIDLFSNILHLLFLLPLQPHSLLLYTGSLPAISLFLCFFHNKASLRVTQIYYIPVLNLCRFSAPSLEESPQTLVNPLLM
jgi:hypothetical protein